MLAEVRSFFAGRGVLEVETPILSASTVTNPATSSLEVRANARIVNRQWLHTSPEYHMKRMLADGFPDIYQVCRVFRDDEIGRWHRREFTMIEWYRLGMNLGGLIDETVDLFSTLAATADRQLEPAERVPYRTAFQQATGLDPCTAGDNEILAAAQRVDESLRGLDRHSSIDLLMVASVAPAMPVDRLTILYDYPSDQADLARLCPTDSRLAERFEIFLGTVEIANGYRELTDPDELAGRMKSDRAYRAQCGMPDVPSDSLLLDAMRHGLPECAGVAVGFDRCLALLLGQDSLAGTMAFSGREQSG
jgi:lysyl-tRNA synthetase class 2